MRKFHKKPLLVRQALLHAGRASIPPSVPYR